MSEWIDCIDRLPLQADAGECRLIWICSPIGAVWLVDYTDVSHGTYPVYEGGWYWMPANLTKPEPPQ